LSLDEAATNGTPIFAATKALVPTTTSPPSTGATGGGLPLALGAAIACPDRKVVHLQADGSGVYTVQALWSMAREKTDIVIVVLKNDAYAILGLEMARIREKELNPKMKSMLDLSNPTLDWCISRRASACRRRGRERPRSFIDSSRLRLVPRGHTDRVSSRQFERLGRARRLHSSEPLTLCSAGMAESGSTWQLRTQVTFIFCLLLNPIAWLKCQCSRRSSAPIECLSWGVSVHSGPIN
jgi:Thiamine pyrophosphate enzyme, C-terminal TPP binding domain